MYTRGNTNVHVYNIYCYVLENFPCFLIHMHFPQKYKSTWAIIFLTITTVIMYVEIFKIGVIAFISDVKMCLMINNFQYRSHFLRTRDTHWPNIFVCGLRLVQWSAAHIGRMFNLTINIHIIYHCTWWSLHQISCLCSVIIHLDNLHNIPIKGR
jgi:hypothetical protein